MLNVQEWLSSLNAVNRLRGYETLPDDPKASLAAVPGFPLSGDLNNLDSDTLHIIGTRQQNFE